MASASALRTVTSPPAIPPPPPPDFPADASCPFRRSKSRVFYESEYNTTRTSWEFRDVQMDSPPPPFYYHTHQMQHHLSVLRSSPQVLHTTGLTSPGPGIIADLSSSVNHRSIPSPPTKNDLGGSDGSRNSTGSSTGSHRSQDSGFSDSGEARSSRKSVINPNANANSPHLLNGSQLVSLSPRNQLQLVACNELSCSQLIHPQDANRNYFTHSSNNGHLEDPGSRTSATFVLASNLNHNQYQSPGIHQHFVHERCYSTPDQVPSPIPHLESGCGKLFFKNGSTFTLSKSSNTNHHHQQHPSITEYGEINGNNTVGECSNCMYQEIQSQQPQVNCNSSQYHHHHTSPHQHHHNCSTATAAVEPGNYSVYSTIEQNGQLGVPICSSTPKRSNLSSSRITIMQKIDNFESLNKNQRSLDNNNNSNSSNSNAPSSNVTPSTSTGEVTTTKKTSTHGILSTTSHEKTTNSGKTSKKHSKLSLSLLSTNSSTSSQTKTTHNTSACSNNSNKTVVQRAPIPIPQNDPASANTSTHHHHERGGPSSASWSQDGENKNNSSFTPNEFATYASHSQLKSCSKISPKWKILPKGYKRVSSKDLASSFTADAGVQTSQDKCVIVKSHFDNDAMRLWLHELRSQTENECFYMLQTKSIPSPEDLYKTATTGGTASDSDSGTYGSQESRESEKCRKIKNGKSVVQAIHDISSPLMSIKNVEQMANVVSAEFAKICKNIEFGFLSQVPDLVLNLVSYVEDFLRTFQGSTIFGNLQKLEHKLARSCRRLQRSAQMMLDMTRATALNGSDAYQHHQQHTEAQSVYSIMESENLKKGEGYHVAVSEVVDGIVSVGNLFSQVVDLRLTRDLSCILDTVEGGGVPAKVALKSFVTILIDGGNHLCRLASEIRTVRGLLGVILDAKDDYLRILSLRCLATILCVGDAVKDFDRASGFEIVADFMYEPTYSFDLKIEAVSVLTQATDPWIDLETSLGTLGLHLEKIVVALTNLVPDCVSMEEPFLLVVAAISNLTFLETSSMEILRRCGTMSLIINAIEVTSCNFSVFVYDHIATILANMAGVESCRDCIVKSAGVHALLNFLQKRPTPNAESASEIMACERVQQKSTIAISRLCAEEGVAKLILERGGLHRLIQLSRNEKERNYSDGVLIAALATLRKLVSICGDDVIQGLHADDLIHPRLLDSFLLYSSRQESYV